MMTGNEPMLTGAPPEDATACGVSVQDPSVQDRLAWIDERLEFARDLAGSNSLACWYVSELEEFAELLRVHFAGVES